MRADNAGGVEPDNKKAPSDTGEACLVRSSLTSAEQLRTSATGGGLGRRRRFFKHEAGHGAVLKRRRTFVKSSVKKSGQGGR